MTTDNADAKKAVLQTMQQENLILYVWMLTILSSFGYPVSSAIVTKKTTSIATFSTLGHIGVVARRFLWLGGGNPSSTSLVKGKLPSYIFNRKNNHSQIRGSSRDFTLFGSSMSSSIPLDSTLQTVPVSDLDIISATPSLSSSLLEEEEDNDDDSTAANITTGLDDNNRRECRQSFDTKMAKRVSTSARSLEQIGARLREGSLVAFPTETVYGLGCHALDPVAIARVFTAKERPLTDPLIVHVLQKDEAFSLWLISTKLEHLVLTALTEEFWPGPLTIVAKADSHHVPSIVMANTGFVACRSPSHVIARLVLEAARVPIAAPSANKFGHVSPTRAQHVWDDLKNENVWIVDPDLNDPTIEENGLEWKDKKRSWRDGSVCEVGVESTVAKIEMSSSTKGKVIVLRHGSVSTFQMERALQMAGLGEMIQVTATVRATADNVANEAPGQTIRHYSPHVPCYMISIARSAAVSDTWMEEEVDLLKMAVILDFGGRLRKFQRYALAYRDLSIHGSSKEATFRVFDTLRWSENVPGALRIYVPELSISPSQEDDALFLALKDRLTRASSGIVMDTFS